MRKPESRVRIAGRWWQGKVLNAIPSLLKTISTCGLNWFEHADTGHGIDG
jgi:hypothetical protein